MEMNQKELTSEILDSMCDGIISINKTGEIVYANDAACAILELQAKNIVNESLLSIFLDREDNKNDQISQLFIDVVQNKAKIKKQLVSYFPQKERKIEITLSKNISDVDSEPSGLLCLCPMSPKGNRM